MRSILIKLITRPSTKLLWPFNFAKLSKLWSSKLSVGGDQLNKFFSRWSSPICRKLKVTIIRFDSPISCCYSRTFAQHELKRKGLWYSPKPDLMLTFLIAVVLFLWAVKLNLFVDRTRIRSKLNSLFRLIDRIKAHQWVSDRQTSLHGLFSGWSMKKPRLLIAPLFPDLVEGVTTPVIQVIFNRSIGGEEQRSNHSNW